MILALSESSVPLSVRTLAGVLSARRRVERMNLYRDELLYLDVKRHYRDVTSPQDVSEKLFETERKAQSKEKVIASILKKLG